MFRWRTDGAEARERHPSRHGLQTSAAPEGTGPVPVYSGHDRVGFEAGIRQQSRERR
jgi:hypothetical protein